MDFFQYASIAAEFGGGLLISLLIGAMCFAIVFIFEGVALFIIAKREGYKHKWMAFIPFFNTYYIGVCAQKNKFYNIDAKKIGLAVAIFEFVLVIGYILYYVASYLVVDYLEPYTLTNSWGMTYEDYKLIGVPNNLSWAAWIYNYLFLILNVAELVYLLLEVFLLFCFFQTYACRRYLLFTFTSVLFPIQGILFFVVRNNKGVNYKEFLRNEQAKRYRMYHQYQQNFYQNPYNQNPYNRNDNYNNGATTGEYNGSSSARQTPPEDPFGGLGGTGGSDNSNGSPFDDYN